MGKRQPVQPVIACVLALSVLPAGAAPQQPTLSTTPSWQIDTPYPAFGSAIAGVGDVNDDGFADVMLGADGSRIIAAAHDPGRALLFAGSASGLPLAASWVHERLPQTRFGQYVAPAGDVNADGFDDVIVGAPGYIPPPDERLPPLYLPRAHLFLGSASGLGADPVWQSVQSPLGGGTAGVGDVNGDGYDDVVQGDPGYLASGVRVGKVMAFYGSPTGLAVSPSWTILGHQDEAEFGQQVAGAGDVDGDGYDDVLVGAPAYDADTREGVGQALVYHGSPVGLSSFPYWISTSDAAGGRRGFAVASAGDLNRDGYGDVIVGEPGNGTTHPGAVLVYYGSAAGLATTPAWTATARGVPGFGSLAASAGDHNGDGYPDIVVGAPRCQTGTTPSGQAYVFDGSPAGLAELPSWTSATSAPDLCYPESVASAGDVNGDGLSDLVVSGTVDPYFQQLGAMAEAYYGARLVTRFYSLPPCRVVDTRNPGEGPALAANTQRAFTVRGLCGVPAEALVVAANVTAVNATDLGNLRVFAAGTALPLASTINFVAGQTRANNAIVPLGPEGQLAVRCDMPPSSTGAVHLVVDVSGYFR